MKKTRIKHTAAFVEARSPPREQNKAKVALAAVRGLESIADLAKRCPGRRSCPPSRVRERLGAILRAPARAEGDWTLSHPLGCACDDCKELWQLLRSARADRDWPPNKDGSRFRCQSGSRARVRSRPRPAHHHIYGLYGRPSGPRGQPGQVPDFSPKSGPPM